MFLTDPRIDKSWIMDPTPFQTITKQFVTIEKIGCQKDQDISKGTGSASEIHKYGSGSRRQIKFCSTGSGTLAQDDEFLILYVTDLSFLLKKIESEG